jgi:hypothetical protein
MQLDPLSSLYVFSQNDARREKAAAGAAFPI